VLAVKDEGEDTLAACGGLRSLTAARAAMFPRRAIPPETSERTMRVETLYIRDAQGDFIEASGDTVLAAAKAHMNRRVHRGVAFTSPRVVRDYLAVTLGARDCEYFCLALLDARHRLIEFVELFRGTIDGASVHPREVVKLALARGAAAVVVVHNHPSQIAEPSQADELITRRLKDALQLIDVRVLDHLVVAGSNVLSMAERGLI
jgi:DNA repair protein RadC